MSNQEKPKLYAHVPPEVKTEVPVRMDRINNGVVCIYRAIVTSEAEKAAQLAQANKAFMDAQVALLQPTEIPNADQPPADSASPRKPEGGADTVVLLDAAAIRETVKQLQDNSDAIAA